MTVKQFRKKVEIARKCGKAHINDNCVLYYYRDRLFSLVSSDGNVIDTTYRPETLEYLFE